MPLSTRDLHALFVGCEAAMGKLGVHIFGDVKLVPYILRFVVVFWSLAPVILNLRTIVLQMLKGVVM